MEHVAGFVRQDWVGVWKQRQRHPQQGLFHVERFRSRESSIEQYCLFADTSVFLTLAVAREVLAFPTST